MDLWANNLKQNRNKGVIGKLQNEAEPEQGPCTLSKVQA
jgi:hypothetical protein